MINKETAKVSYETVADQSAWYAVDFEYLKTPSTGLPQLMVTLDGNVLKPNVDYITGVQGIQLTSAPEAGKTLVITRDVPFVQDLDFQMGIVDPKKIERGLDESVMRDQELLSRIDDLADADAELEKEVEEVRGIAEGAATSAASAVQTATDAANAASAASNKAEQASSAAAAASAKAQTALDTANSYDARIENAESTANEASAKANAVDTKATSAMTKADTADAKAQQALTKANTNATAIAQNTSKIASIEQVIPDNASTSNKLVAQSDLSAVDALPSQAGNGGKFLTTNGEQAEWAEVKQGSGGGIEWVVKRMVDPNPEDPGAWVYPTFVIPKLPVGKYRLFIRTMYADSVDAVLAPCTSQLLLSVRQQDNDTSFSIASGYVLDENFVPTGNSNLGVLSARPSVYTDASRPDKLLLTSEEWSSFASNVFSQYGGDYGAQELFSISAIENLQTGEKYTDVSCDVRYRQLIPDGLELRPTSISVYPYVAVPSFSTGVRTSVSLYKNGEANGIVFYNTQTTSPNDNVNGSWIASRETYISLVASNPNTQERVGELAFRVTSSFSELCCVVDKRTGVFSNCAIYRSPEDSKDITVCTEDMSLFNLNDIDADILDVVVQACWNGGTNEVWAGTTVFSEPLERITEVSNPGSGGGAVDSVNGKTGAVVLTASDVSAVAIDQGTNNAGKFLKVGADGQVIVSSESAGGGLTSVAHDSTLSGAGTDADPLKVSDAVAMKTDIPDVSNFATKDEIASKADKSALPQNQTGTAGQVYTKTDDGAEWKDASGGASLPDQTGNAGKFLTTDGATTSWGEALVNQAKYPSYQIAIGGTTTSGTTGNIVIGHGSSSSEAYSIAIGRNCKVSAMGSILLSARGNTSSVINKYAEVTEEHSFYVGLGDTQEGGLYKLLGGGGTIPAERLATDGTTGQVLSKTENGMAWTDVTGGTSEIVHDATLSGSGTEESPLGLSESTKDEIASKADSASVTSQIQEASASANAYTEAYFSEHMKVVDALPENPVAGVFYFVKKSA